MQGMFGLYAGSAFLPGSYIASSQICMAMLRASRNSPWSNRVHRLTVSLHCFCVDAFGGGFFVQTILVLCCFTVRASVTQRQPISSSGPILLTAASYLAAPAIARRFGLINTMVFTHLPSSLCLIAIPFIQTLE